GGGGGAWGSPRGRARGGATAPAGPVPATAPALALPEALQQGFVGVAEHVRPAVVHLGTIQRAKMRRGPSLPPGTDDPFFKDFFNQFFGSEGPCPKGGGDSQPRFGSGGVLRKTGAGLPHLSRGRGGAESHWC